MVPRGSQCPSNACTFFGLRDAVKMQPEVRESLWLGRRATGPCRRRGNALRGGSLRLNGHPYTCHRPSWGVVRIKSAVAHCGGISQTLQGARGPGADGVGVRVPVNQWSQLSHFSSCLTVLVLSTPQLALLEVAQGAFSWTWWPQPYVCMTLVHMLAAVGGAREVREARGVREAGAGQRGGADWQGWWAATRGSCCLRRAAAACGGRRHNGMDVRGDNGWAAAVPEGVGGGDGSDGAEHGSTASTTGATSKECEGAMEAKGRGGGRPASRRDEDVGRRGGFITKTWQQACFSQAI
ncbi:hypothetical protein K505DRAFT_379302 [Melanomma pulvis-pyrius CBS 109.77]|uniref:Uncharacterized protein n=1 Tax=Melanomma pulvis-pyrius CBS 109.77 TaxID=1314802 RepID=A0A6A6WVD8_9PLEO|nr:hypothetical protein K505DRAFT_379302 [Melanomma pulvis-pyrius CBS 109.77]